MKINIVIIGLISAIFLAYSPPVKAEESTSFQLYHEVPNYAERGPAASDSFQMNEDGVTWTAMPLTGSNFQIVTAPPSAAVGEEEEEGGEEEEEEEEKDRGGHRGEGTTYPPSPGEEPDKPAAPVEPDKPAPVIPPEFPLEPITPGIRYPQADILFVPPSGFLKIDQYVMVPVRCAPQRGMSPEAWKLLQDSWRQQMFVAILVGIAGISFLMAFQLVLLKIPQSLLLSSRIGSILFLPIPFRRRKKEDEKKKRKKNHKRTSTRSRK